MISNIPPNLRSTNPQKPVDIRAKLQKASLLTSLIADFSFKSRNTHNLPNRQHTFEILSKAKANLQEVLFELENQTDSSLKQEIAEQIRSSELQLTPLIRPKNSSFQTLEDLEKAIQECRLFLQSQKKAYDDSIKVMSLGGQPKHSITLHEMQKTATLLRVMVEVLKTHVNTRGDIDQGMSSPKQICEPGSPTNEDMNWIIDEEGENKEAICQTEHVNKAIEILEAEVLAFSRELNRPLAHAYDLCQKAKDAIRNAVSLAKQGKMTQSNHQALEAHENIASLERKMEQMRSQTGSTDYETHYRILENLLFLIKRDLRKASYRHHIFFTEKLLSLTSDQKSLLKKIKRYISNPNDPGAVKLDDLLEKPANRAKLKQLIDALKMQFLLSPNKGIHNDAFESLSLIYLHLPEETVDTDEDIDQAFEPYKKLLLVGQKLESLKSTLDEYSKRAAFGPIEMLPHHQQEFLELLKLEKELLAEIQDPQQDSSVKSAYLSAVYAISPVLNKNKDHPLSKMDQAIAIGNRVHNFINQAKQSALDHDLASARMHLFYASEGMEEIEKLMDSLNSGFSPEVNRRMAYPILKIVYDPLKEDYEAMANYSPPADTIGGHTHLYEEYGIFELRPQPHSTLFNLFVSIISIIVNAITINFQAGKLIEYFFHLVFGRKELKNLETATPQAIADFLVKIQGNILCDPALIHNPKARSKVLALNWHILSELNRLGRSEEVNKILATNPINIKFQQKWSFDSEIHYFLNKPIPNNEIEKKDFYESCLRLRQQVSKLLTTNLSSFERLRHNENLKLLNNRIEKDFDAEALSFLEIETKETESTNVLQQMANVHSVSDSHFQRESKGQQSLVQTEREVKLDLSQEQTPKQDVQVVAERESKRQQSQFYAQTAVQNEREVKQELSQEQTPKYEANLSRIISDALIPNLRTLGKNEVGIPENTLFTVQRIMQTLIPNDCQASINVPKEENPRFFTLTVTRSAPKTMEIGVNPREGVPKGTVTIPQKFSLVFEKDKQYLQIKIEGDVTFSNVVSLPDEGDMREIPYNGKLKEIIIPHLVNSPVAITFDNDKQDFLHDKLLKNVFPFKQPDISSPPIDISSMQERQTHLKLKHEEVSKEIHLWSNQIPELLETLTKENQSGNTKNFFKALSTLLIHYRDGLSLKEKLQHIIQQSQHWKMNLSDSTDLSDNLLKIQKILEADDIRSLAMELWVKEAEELATVQQSIPNYANVFNSLYMLHELIYITVGYNAKPQEKRNFIEAGRKFRDQMPLPQKERKPKAIKEETPSVVPTSGTLPLAQTTNQNASDTLPLSKAVPQTTTSSANDQVEDASPIGIVLLYTSKKIKNFCSKIIPESAKVVRDNNTMMISANGNSRKNGSVNVAEHLKMSFSLPENDNNSPTIHFHDNCITMDVNLRGKRLTGHLMQIAFNKNGGAIFVFPSSFVNLSADELSQFDLLFQDSSEAEIKESRSFQFIGNEREFKEIDAQNVTSTETLPKFTPFFKLIFPSPYELILKSRDHSLSKYQVKFQNGLIKFSHNVSDKGEHTVLFDEPERRILLKNVKIKDSHQKEIIGNFDVTKISLLKRGFVEIVLRGNQTNHSLFFPTSDEALKFIQQSENQNSSL